MKRKPFKIFLLLAAAILLVFGLTACSNGNPLTEEQLEAMGYNVVVTYDFNGGLNSDSLPSVVIRVRKGSRIPEPGGKGASFGTPNKAMSSLRGFYRGTKTENGIEYNETQWNFATDTVTESMTLYARWWDNFMVQVHCDDTASDRIKEFSVARDTVTGQAEMVYAEYFSATSLDMNDRTIVGYYADAACTQELTFPRVLDFVDEEGGRVIDIYVKSLEGNWTVIDTPERFAKGFSAYENIYLKNDLDMEGLTVTLPVNYGGIFEGNGKTISNLSVERTVNNTASGTVYLGLFGELAVGTKIANVTFENLNVTVTLSNSQRVRSYYLGLFAGRAAANAVLENVTVGGTLRYLQNNSDAEIVVAAWIGLNSASETDCRYDGATIEKIEQ